MNCKFTGINVKMIKLMAMILTICQNTNVIIEIRQVNGTKESSLFFLRIWVQHLLLHHNKLLLWQNIP
jgi:hypothetical protein